MLQLAARSHHLLAPHPFRSSSASHDIGRTLVHAAVWRVMWGLPLVAVVGLGVVGAFFAYRRRA